MKILFVCSGNHGLSPIVSAQADSLVKAGHEVQIHRIVGKGIWGYLSNVPKLHSVIRRTRFDAIHAHYSFCGIACALATRRPIVCSLMGSDVIQSGVYRKVIRFFVKYIWGATIVKSQDMKDKLGLSKLQVIANGIDLEHFRPMDRTACRAQLGWDEGQYALFLADPERPEKNYALAEAAVIMVPGLRIKVVSKVKHSEVPVFLNASNVVILSSLWEGSPNVVKEAMACDVKVVSTDVGDVRYLFGDTPGYYLCGMDPASMAEALISALSFTEVRGRERIIELGLKSDDVVRKLVNSYTGLSKQ